MSTALDDLEALYRETGNVTYLWEALAGLGPEAPWPAWIRSYLAEAAGAVAALFYELAPSPGPRYLPPTKDKLPPNANRLSPEQVVEKIPAALGFVKPGRNGNAIAARRQMESDAVLAVRYETALKPGTSESLVTLAAKQTGQSKATVRRRIARARTGWSTQE
jgi:hypothetical protein